MKYNQSIIAIKQSRPLNGNRGFVTPIAKEIDEGTYIPVEDHEFPNNRRIWVSKDYDIIDDKFDYNEPFKVLEYNEDSESLYKIQENKEQYWMKGNDTEALQKNEIYVIIKSNLPKVETPYLDTVPNISNLSQHIFIDDDDSQSLYGPFDVSKTDEGFKISPSTINALSLRSDHIYKISKKNIFHLIISHNSLDMAYIISADKIKTEVQFEEYDYVSDAKLISWGNKNLFDSNIPLLAEDQISEWVKAVKISICLDTIEETRKERLVKLIPKILDANNNRYALIGECLNRNKEIRNNYLEENKKKFFDKAIAKIEKKAEVQKSKLLKEIEQLEIKRNKINESIGNIKGINEDLILDQIKEQEGSLKEEKNRLELEIKKNTEKVDSQKNKISVMESRLKDLSNIEDLKKEIEYYEKQKGHLKKDIERLHSHDLKNKLAEIETYIDVLNGGEKIKSRFCKLDNDEKKLCHNIQTHDFKGSKRDFVDIVHKYLYKECGRNYSTDEIANILICIHNNFLTLLTGPPGAGKTSMIHFLAESLGNSKNLLSLSTSRGWTSQRDILGYFNPLNKKYQKARTGLYDFISSSNDEFAKFPRWVLLDEANLSPMEHYWADFLGMSDPEGNRCIETGASDEDKYLEIPDSLRFIGTINNDHTTERLSPRLIDRAAIIKLEPQDFFSNSQKHNRNEPDSAFTNETFESVFQESEDYDFNSEEADIVKDIIKILRSESSEFEGAPIIIISPRKYFAIKRYCSTAKDVFEKETPLDFAISQNILPQIEGYGIGFVKRLTRLQEILTNNGLNRSEKTLERIICSGKQNHHSYSFFG